MEQEQRKIRVLFICTHNSARSQMAEAFLKNLGGDRFEVESAGLKPTAINPLVVEVMAELGYDLSQNRTQSVFDLYKACNIYDYIITVCNDSDESLCPIFPGVQRRWHWPFPDPSQVEGTREEKLNQIRVIRDMILERIKSPRGDDRLLG